ncbi:MAG: hypothetical protein ACI3ZR_02695 [bacterium]
MENTQLTKKENKYLTCQGEVSQEEWSQEMNGLTPTFDRIKVPSGGGLAFKVPGENDGEFKAASELIGVIVDHYPVNAYWKEKYTGENNAPDCASLDGKFGEGNPGGACKSCPMNQWGSDQDGRGKACKNMHRIFLLQEGEAMPIQLTIPPTSLKNLSNYIMKKLLTRGYKTETAVTRISLKTERSKGGIEYSQASFSFVEGLNEYADQMKAYRQSIMPVTRSQEIERNEDNNVFDESEEIPF